MKYKDATLGIIEAVFNKLGGIQGVELFLANKTKVVSAVNLTEGPPILKIIELGTKKSRRELESVLEQKGFSSNYLVKNVLDRGSNILSERKALTLVAVSAAELGFKTVPKYQTILDSAFEKFSLRHCPTEVALQICIQNSGISKNIWFYLGMLPVLEEVDPMDEEASPDEYVLRVKFGNEKNIEGCSIKHNPEIGLHDPIIFYRMS